MRRRLLRTSGLATTAVAALTISSLVATTQAGSAAGVPAFGSDAPKVVASQLDNPRGLAVGAGGSLYVALSGNGGTQCEGEGEDEFCAGNTSSIAKIRAPWSKNPQVTTVLDGYASFAGPDGSFAGGLPDVDVDGLGRIWSGGAQIPEQGPIPESGPLFYVKKNGQAVDVADITQFEAANDPDGQGVESNPYALLVQSKRVLVADAAGNSIVSVNKKTGDMSLFHVFPNITTGDCAGQPNEAGTTGCDFVPTDVTEGPAGTIWVTGLAAEVPGEGRVAVLSKNGTLLKEFSGFTTPSGVAVRWNGTFYVSELLANFPEGEPEGPPDASSIGQVTKVNAFTNARSSRVVPLPAGIVVIGTRVYVSAYSVAPASGLFGNPDWNGQVWSFRG